MKIGIFHGIDTPEHYVYKNIAEKAIRSDLILDPEVLELRWPSTGTISGDVWNLMVSKSFREYCRESAAHSLNWALFKKVDLLIAHSMGCVMLLEAVKKLQPIVDLPPIIMIGSPLSHPIWGNSLRAVDLGRVPKYLKKIKNVWNPDDIVPAWHGWQTSPKGFSNVKINVLGCGKIEHPMDLYLSHPKTRKLIADLINKRLA